MFYWALLMTLFALTHAADLQATTLTTFSTVTINQLAYVPVATVDSTILLGLATSANNANNALGQTLSKGAKIADIAEHFDEVKSRCIKLCQGFKNPVYVFLFAQIDFRQRKNTPYVRAYCTATDISFGPSEYFNLDPDVCVKTFTRLLDQSACTGNKPECKDGQNFGGRLVDGPISYVVYGELMPK